MTTRSSFRYISRHPDPARSRAGTFAHVAISKFWREPEPGICRKSGQGFLLDRARFNPAARMADPVLLLQDGQACPNAASPLILDMRPHGDGARITFVLFFADRSLLVCDGIHKDEDPGKRDRPWLDNLRQIRIHPIIHRISLPQREILETDASIIVRPVKMAPSWNGKLTANYSDGSEIFSISPHYSLFGDIIPRIPFAPWRRFLENLHSALLELAGSARGWKSPLHPLRGGHPDSEWPRYLSWSSAKSAEDSLAIEQRLAWVSRLAHDLYMKKGCDHPHSRSRMKLVARTDDRTPAALWSSNTYADPATGEDVLAVSRSLFFQGAWKDFDIEGWTVRVQNESDGGSFGISTHRLFTFDWICGRVEPLSAHQTVEIRGKITRQEAPQP